MPKQVSFAKCTRFLPNCQLIGNFTFSLFHQTKGAITASIRKMEIVDQFLDAHNIQLTDEQKGAVLEEYLPKVLDASLVNSVNGVITVVGGEESNLKLPGTTRKRPRRYCYLCKTDIINDKGVFKRHCKMHFEHHKNRVRQVCIVVLV